VSARPAAIGTRTPPWRTTWPATCAPAAIVSANAQAGHEHAPAAEQIGGAPAEQEQAAEHQRVAPDRPAGIGAVDAEVGREVGQRDVHGRDVEYDHQLGQAEQKEERHGEELHQVGQ